MYNNSQNNTRSSLPSLLPTVYSMQVNARHSLNGQEDLLNPKQRMLRKYNKINARQDAEDDKITENISKIIHEGPSGKEFEWVSGILKHHFFFYNMVSAERDVIVKKLVLCSAESGSYIFKQGDPASAFFIIQEGTVQVEISGKPKRTLKKGDFFGELGLIYMAPRSASIKATSNVKLWVLTRGLFKKTLEDIVLKNYETAKKHIAKLPLFSFLTDQQKDSIAYSMFSLKYEEGETIFKENDDANAFYVIVEGSVQITIKGKNNLVLTAGESFGEQAFMDNQFRGGNASAKGGALLMSIGREAIKNTLGGQINNIIHYNITKWAIKRSTILSKLSNVNIEKVLQNYHTIQIKNGEKVQRKGDKIDRVYISLEGTLDQMPTGVLIGEEYFNDYKKATLAKDIIKGGDGAVSYIRFEDIEKLTGLTAEDIIKNQGANSYEKKMEEDAKTADYSHITLDSLRFVKKLGEGQFGKVQLVKRKGTNEMYAVKCIQKQQVVENKMEKTLIEEKSILSIINSPFLLKFYQSLKDQHHIYLLMEYIKGSQLFDVIREIGLLNKTVSRFYISSLILSIEYLHMKNIVYRDLKPENVMVEYDGYLKLIDMGTAKRLKQANGFRTFTIIGTPHYMAPEVMQGKGYTYSVDIWSLGVVLYEFLCGQLPFGEDMDDPYEIHSQIMRAAIKYPSFFTDQKAKDLIEQLLNKAPDQRLSRGFAALKANPFFDGLDWEALYDKKMKSPYIPEKARHPEKPLPEGQPFLDIMVKEKPKSSVEKKSSMPGWDNEF